MVRFRLFPFPDCCSYYYNNNNNISSVNNINKIGSGWWEPPSVLPPTSPTSLPPCLPASFPEAVEDAPQLQRCFVQDSQEGKEML